MVLNTHDIAIKEVAVALFNRIHGNAKGCLVVEPMFILPYSLFSTYASVYMLGLGVSSWQIGWLTSLGLLLQIFTSFISGFLTDRLGRRRALFIFDVVSWTVATLIWAISRNFWFFLAAAVLNSFQKVPNTAWYCLLVEDTPPKERSIVFTVLQFIGVLGGLFAPVGGLLVAALGMVPAVRIMYGLACISMTSMIAIRHFLTHETEIGRNRAGRKSDFNIRQMLREYTVLLKSVLRNRTLLLLFFVYALFQFQNAVRTAYLSIFLVKHLQFSDALIAWFPAVSSAAMLVLMYTIVPRFNEKHAYAYMIAGCVCSVLSMIMLIFSPLRSVGIVIGSTALFAAGSLLAGPYLESSVANAMNDEERANSMSVLSVLILIVISPSGIISGWAYNVDPRIPFWLIAGTFALCSVLLLIVMKTDRGQRTRSGAASNL